MHTYVLANNVTCNAIMYVYAALDLVITTHVLIVWYMYVRKFSHIVAIRQL